LLVAAAVVAGLVVPAGAVTVHTRHASSAAGTALPNPGPLLNAPRSLAAAEAEVKPVLAQAAKPKTALVGTVRLLVNAGVTIVNGPKTLFAGRRGGPPLYMQAGQVWALARDLSGPTAALSAVLKSLAGADVRQLVKYATPAFWGKNFAVEITGASDASEYLWGAVLVDADTSAHGLLASLKGAGTPADALTPLQVGFLMMRLESDTLRLAATYHTPTRAAAAAAGPTAAGGVTCDISYVPGSVFEGLAAKFSAQIPKVLAEAKLAAKALKYGQVMNLSAEAATVLNLLVMMGTLNVDTTVTPSIFTRTQNTDPKDVTAVPGHVRSVFSFADSGLQWVNCIRLILDIAGVDVSAPGSVIADTHVGWEVGEGDPATIDPSTYETNSAGVATTWIEGTPQPAEIAQPPVPYIRPITITAWVNPLASRSAGDLLVHYTLITLQGYFGNALDRATAVVSLGSDAIQASGLIRRSKTVQMRDWVQYPTGFSASFSVSDPAAPSQPGAQDGLNFATTNASIPAGNYEASSGGYYAGNVATGRIKWSLVNTYIACGEGQPLAGSGTSLDAYLSAAPSSQNPQLARLVLQTPPIGITCGNLDENPSQQFFDDLTTNDSASLWTPGATTTTVPLYQIEDNHAVGTITFHWLYAGQN